MADTSERPTTPAEVLCAAADYIEEHGWIRDDYGRYEEGVCVLGACRAVLGDDPVDEFVEAEAPDLFWEAARQLLRHVRPDVADAEVLPEVPDWNDEQCESQEQAVAALRAAAGGCREVA